MLRLLVWLWRHVIVGQKRLPKPAPCRRQHVHSMEHPAAPFCELGLCGGCCDQHCGCFGRELNEHRALVSGREA